MPLLGVGCVGGIDQLLGVGCVGGIDQLILTLPFLTLRSTGGHGQGRKSEPDCVCGRGGGTDTFSPTAASPKGGASPKKADEGGGGGGDSDTFFPERHLRRKSRKSKCVGVPNPHHEHQNSSYPQNVGGGGTFDIVFPTWKNVGGHVPPSPLPGFAPMGMAPPPCAPLSYASEQHATEDLEKKGREKSMHAYHVGLCTARSRQKRALAPACRQRGIGKCMTEISA